MTNINHIPSPPLNAYIDDLYYIDGSMPYPREKIMPDSRLDLKINCQDQCQPPTPSIA